MAKEDDMFAPPTEEELKAAEEDLFAPPTEEELAELDSLEEGIVDTEMGAGEALMTGLGEGATLGLGPILAGATGAVGEAGGQLADVLGITEDAELREQGFKLPEDDKSRLERIIDEYYKSRDIAIKQQEKAFEDQPLATIAGSIAGGAAVPIGGAAKGATAAKKALEAAKIGATAGAATGFGSGKAKLLEGEVGEALKETATGATVGGVLGAGLSGVASGVAATGKGIKGAGKAIKDFAKNSQLAQDIKAGYAAGQAGIDISDVKGITKLQEGFAKDVKSIISKTFKGNTKKQMLEQADEMGIKINAGEAVEDIIKDMKSSGFIGETAQKELTKFHDELRSAQKGYNKKLEKAIEKVDKKRAVTAKHMEDFGGKVETSAERMDEFEDLLPLPDTEGKVVSAMDKYKFYDPKTGEAYYDYKRTAEAVADEAIPLQQYDLQSMKPSEVEKLKRQMGTAFKETPTAATEFKKDLYTKLKDLQEVALENPEYAQSNENFLKLYNAIDSLGIDASDLTSKVASKRDKATKKLLDMAFSENAPKEFDRVKFLEYLHGADADAATAVESRFKAMKSIQDITGISDPYWTGSAKATAVKAVPNVLRRMGHFMGAQTAKGKEAAKLMTKATNEMVEYSPQQIQELTDALLGSNIKGAEAFKGPLEKAATAENDRTRKTLMYGITRQSAFQELLRRVSKGTAINDEESIDE